jgi:methyl-accepting chemotaxis protein
MASSDEYYQEWVDRVRELYDHVEDALIAMNNASRSVNVATSEQKDEMNSIVLQLEDLLSSIDDLEHDDPEPV